MWGEERGRGKGAERWRVGGRRMELGREDEDEQRAP